MRKSIEVENLQKQIFAKEMEVAALKKENIELNQQVARLKRDLAESRIRHGELANSVSGKKGYWG